MPQPLVLIADDDPLLRQIVEHKLTACGYAVVAVEDGQMALTEARRMKPPVLILDAMMPVVDGFEALRRLKADPELTGVQVIMLTALKRQEDIVGALQLGAADYLAKPFNPDELVARVARLAPVTR
ncbi:PleD family two-component system response regulator [Phenylobacterium sp.]|jgi:DNA-binding response OmpR family regulator|uniref:PleD family two-component system response regulator n=1 Tax=Phenylobacterium sp. TaxID=1871053 RepID=UPI003782D680